MSQGHIRPLQSTHPYILPSTRHTPSPRLHSRRMTTTTTTTTTQITACPTRIALSKIDSTKSLSQPALRVSEPLHQTKPTRVTSLHHPPDSLRQQSTRIPIHSINNHRRPYSRKTIIRKDGFFPRGRRKSRAITTEGRPRRELAEISQ